MSFFNVFDVTASAMKAQSVRLNTTASNLANADSISSSIDQTYRARKPVFAAEFTKATQFQGDSAQVKVAGIVESDAPLRKEYYPEHPMANEEGYIFKPNVNVIEEMADMMSASRSYQANVQVTEAAKQMLNSTLNLGKS
ncbi:MULTISPECIES: flagellar basal body rod protein FlgC [unclassified Agarivorans]|uniref:flagellar basal body rod protein FlgC n=1 Tax=unclassified Agarivorans TaxID=2636026 RepID=UPI0010E955B7|nr:MULTISPECIES: flagellar basal body rod protein FlgC [unclassified Agarivorans]MDO6684688.1 flagellar basal body rod protein FlgC [Agarivorans sp. 3_MG-2023]MDO6715151.1 flagellar basal body rod protein FlgC [Agarivorans sp. 2_MG-2023]MDO6763929.1 flagellar basal body rod protein FlgC [Agarivorans sp. 1_MG-2023]GDY27947.1 flagellar basal-body rod protein FlgC [Agarivorans sp. Toyoura001]